MVNICMILDNAAKRVQNEYSIKYNENNFFQSIGEYLTINPLKAPLPMTETGYRSHSHPAGTIERDYKDDVVACVYDLLKEEAKSKTWTGYVETSRQGELF